MTQLDRLPALERLGSLPPRVRATVRAVRRTVREVAPAAEELAYRSQPPRSRSAMWKLARYRIAGADFAGIGAFSSYVCLFFHRGRELDEGTTPLQGSGKTLRFVRLRSPEEASDAVVRRLVRRALRLGAGAGTRATVSSPSVSAQATTRPRRAVTSSSPGPSR